MPESPETLSLVLDWKYEPHAILSNASIDISNEYAKQN